MQSHPSWLPRRLWRLGVALVVLAASVSLFFGAKMAWDDMMTSGEKFDGLGLVIGGIVVAVAVVIGGIHALLLYIEPKNTRAAVVASAVGPALILINRLVSTLGALERALSTRFMVVTLITLAWLTLCSFLVRSDATKTRHKKI